MKTISAARIILDPEISIQAPPNLHPEYITYLNAGINDWGGISPITIDFINPEMDWPEIEKLSKNMKSKGYKLKERLTVYSRYISEKPNYLSPLIQNQILKEANQLAC